MDDPKIFDYRVADLGGRVDPTELHPETVISLNYGAERARGFLEGAAKALPNMPPIYFDYINSGEFNARAFGHGGRYYIGVTRGAVATIALLFDRMLADPQILTFIGDAEKEAVGLPLIPDLGTNYFRTVASLPHFSRPLDPQRLSHAHKLKETAMDFLVAHEFAHIANGHISCMGYKGGSLVFDEVGWAPSQIDSLETKLMRQTMEMDADRTAVRISLGSEWEKVAGRFPRPAGWVDFYNYPGMVMMLWAYAVSSLFRLFGVNRLTGGDVTQESYPRPRLRSFMAHQETGQLPRPEGLKTLPPLIGDDVHKVPLAITAAYRQIEVIFSTITGKPEEAVSLEDAWGDVAQAQKLRLEDYWRKKLKNKLLKFAYHPLSNYE